MASSGKDGIWSLNENTKVGSPAGEWRNEMGEKVLSNAKRRHHSYCTSSPFYFFHSSSFPSTFWVGGGWSSREKTLIPCVTGMRRPVDSSKRQHQNKNAFVFFFLLLFSIWLGIFNYSARPPPPTVLCILFLLSPPPLFENSNKKILLLSCHEKSSNTTKRKQTGFTIAQPKSFLGQDEKNFVSSN